MALTSDQITAQNFKDFYGRIRPYLNGAAHSGFTPIGTVISVMGKTAPMNYLACDGTVYNIADYPELATYFAEQFEASNFFGGNGTTTFAVPDLRGEFLRGTGTNSHENQGNGANVGVHQDGTLHFLNRSNDITSLSMDTPGTSLNLDTTPLTVPRNKVTKSSNDENGALYTARPTNTSVLYCIATKNILMDASNNYSTDEQVVGTWINGKPIYQKTIIDTMPTVTTSGTLVSKYIPVNASVDTYVNSNAYIVNTTTGITAQMTTIAGNINEGKVGRYLLYANIASPSNQIKLWNSHIDWSGSPVYITIQYTKTTA